MAATGHILPSCRRFFTVNHMLRSKLFSQCTRCMSVNTGSVSMLQPQQTRRSGYLDARLYQFQSTQAYSSQPAKKGFIGGLIDNIKTELNKNKEMKDSLKKFREEADKLEQSDALQKAREKYQSIESETAKSSEVLKEKFSVFQQQMQETMKEAQQTEFAKKSREWAGEIGKTAESVSKQAEQLSKSKIVKSVSESAKAIKQEIDESTMSRARPYRAPQKLRKREDHMVKSSTEDKPIEADSEATGMVMHKDSRWSQSWQNFKDNNQYVTKMFDLKMKYDESDNMFVRATRTFTDKMSDLFGGMFSKTEMSEVLTEIVKMDPTFVKEMFIRDCQYDIIPNVLEAMVQGNLDVLEDWCHEAAFNVIATPIKQAQKAGYVFTSRVLDVNNVDVIAGKMMEQGPVLVISFTAQQIMVVSDKAGKVIEGDPEKIMKVFYVWALCRDQNILDPKAAWKIVDLSSSPAEQWV